MLQIRWHGHACWEITNDITLVTDPHDGKSIGIPAPTVAGDIILVYHDNYEVLTQPLHGETYPVIEIWLGAIWLKGGGNYGAPIDIQYDTIELSNAGMLPKYTFLEYIINLGKQVIDKF